MIVKIILKQIKDSLANLALGKERSYTNIGRICFFAVESTSTNYEIKDILNNNVTDAFEIILIPSLKGTLIVSKNLYSYGNINFKIKKL